MWRTRRRGTTTRTARVSRTLVVAVPLALLLASPLGHTTHTRPTRGTPVNLLAVNAEQTLTLAVPTLSERPSRQNPVRASRGRRRRPQTLRRYSGAPTGDLWALVASYSWPADTAWRIMLCESGGNPRARNPHSSATGLFQALRSTWGGYGGYREAADAPPPVQVEHAYRLWLMRGFGPWVCR